MIIELRGLQFVNKGAELMLQAILQELKNSGIEYQLAMKHNSNCPVHKVENIGAIKKVMLQKNRLNLNFLTYYIPSVLRNYLIQKKGIVLEADVDVVLDGSGFAYGDQWGSMHIRQVCSEILRFASHDKKFIFLPQALGPFTRQADIKALKKALPKASLICAREANSYNNISELNSNKSNLRQFPDFTNLVPGDLPDYFRNGEGKFVIIPNNKMLSGQNNNTEWGRTYIQKLVELGKLAKQAGLSVVILNHEGIKDKQICLKIEDELGFSVEQIEEADPLKVKGIIGASKALVCSRFHGCVSALCQGVPCIGTSWSFKYEQLFREYGQEKFLLDSGMSSEELSKLFMMAIQKAPGVISPEASGYKAKSKEMWREVLGLIRS
ncbi:polysaccharide pyruvyl transferase family protein [Alteromonas sp. BMJM2]|uniref:polysaccharide pyruvyl transferase family protein n=1 Tax=Alteromonas sp. BMJM2 TaxID=2954241 RepID=UPI0022B4249A|nr:polysaccharide pyruvyl transferase family protein [Alteromonas sp. BMJM2]